MRICALDPGDVWVGVALADPLGITCRPLTTVSLDELSSYLTTAIPEHEIGTIVVGLPITSGGKESEQTKKAIALKNELAASHPEVTWLAWDERFTSQLAAKQTGKTRDKEAKLRRHAVAAAFILQNYLDNRALAKEL